MNIRGFATEVSETFSAISRTIFLPELLLEVHGCDKNVRVI